MAIEDKFNTCSSISSIESIIEERNWQTLIRGIKSFDIFKNDGYSELIKIERFRKVKSGVKHKLFIKKTMEQIGALTFDSTMKSVEWEWINEEKKWIHPISKQLIERADSFVVKIKEKFGSLLYKYLSHEEVKEKVKRFLDKEKVKLITRKIKGRKGGHLRYRNEEKEILISSELNINDFTWVLFHEVGHYVCGHVDKSIRKSVTDKQKEFIVETIAETLMTLLFDYKCGSVNDFELGKTYRDKWINSAQKFSLENYNEICKQIENGTKKILEILLQK